MTFAMPNYRDNDFALIPEVVLDVDEDIKQKARLTICAHIVDAAVAKEIMQILGLVA